MEEKEIITQQGPQMQMFAQLMEGTLKKLEGRYFTNRATYKQCLKGIITQYPRNYGKNR